MQLFSGITQIVNKFPWLTVNTDITEPSFAKECVVPDNVHTLPVEGICKCLEMKGMQGGGGRHFFQRVGDGSGSKKISFVREVWIIQRSKQY